MNAQISTLTRADETVTARRTRAIRQRPGRQLSEVSEGMPAECSLQQWVATLRAELRPEDVERLRNDAELAAECLARAGSFRSAALRVLEVGHERSSVATGRYVAARRGDDDLETIAFRMRLAASLTKAELRLLPLLATHLSYRGIGQRLFISPNTVKTEAVSAYRKLGASSRGEAVERATELGLIEANAATGIADPSQRPPVTQEQISQLTLVAVVALLTAAADYPGRARHARAEGPVLTSAETPAT